MSIQNKIKLGKLLIESLSPTITIAEISDGHQSSLEHAKKLVDEAIAAGADIVKFQMHLPDLELTRGIKMWAGEEDYQDILKKYWFSPEKHEAIFKYCLKKDIEYLCTPFSLKAIDLLNEMGVAGFKTGSGEIYNLPFQRKLARISASTGKPVLISTGMSSMDELEETVLIHKKEGSNFILMNCTSEYPIRDYSHVNLSLIPILREKFKVHIGQSDHTIDNFTSFAAIPLGAKIIEKHFTLNRMGTFPDDFMSLDPIMFKELVEGIRKIEEALKNKEKIIHLDEKKIRSWAFHSVVSNDNLKKGDTITLEKVRPARPGSGISSKYLDKKYSKQLVGKRVNKDISKNTVIKWEDIDK